jgi:hypothetical protein
MCGYVTCVWMGKREGKWTLWMDEWRDYVSMIILYP